MFVRCSVVLLLLCGRAAAQVPGTGDDPLVRLSAFPEVVDAPLLEGIAIRGGDPDDTRVLYEGFEVPHLFHAPLRSAIAGEAIKRVSLDGDVERGRGTDFLTLEPTAPPARWAGQVTSADLQASFHDPRYQMWGVVRGNPVDTDHLPRYFDGILRAGSVSVIATSATTVRAIAISRISRGGWRTTVALSPLVDRDDLSFDGRIETEHVAPAAGLQRVTWRIGAESINTRHDIGSIVWTPDQAAWSSVTAQLAPNIIARGGIRFDAFMRGRDVATQPRGTIETKVTHDTIVALEAGAYRRPPETADELSADYLHPERTTQVIASIDHERRTYGVNIAGYYIDRTHLIATDPFGMLANGGTGTSKGVEAHATLSHGPWFASLAGSLSSSIRQDYPRGRQHAADFDQPVRVDAVVRYRRGERWQVAARYSLSSGLPYTPVVESTYQSDSDTYVPVLGFTNSERLPWMHRLDIRADVRFNKHFSGFIDLYNAYAAKTAVGYTYSYDFKTRLSTTLPIYPFVGIRGEL